MLRLISQRVTVAIPTLLIVSLLVFALQHALPGDPFLVIAGEERDPESIARLRALYRMDDPVIMQYFAPGWPGPARRVRALAADGRTGCWASSCRSCR